MQSNGIATEIFSLINNEEVRPTANLIVSKCSAYDYLNNSTPNLEKLTTKYYDTFSITDRFTGYFSNVTIGDFYNDLSSNLCEPTAILGGLNSTSRKENSEQSSSDSSSNSSNSSSESSSSSGGSSGSGSSGEKSSQTPNPSGSDKISEDSNIITDPENLTAGTSSIIGKRGTENFGLAVFKDDKLCGELTALESICHLLIQNEVDSCIISIDNPISKQEAEKMELELFPKKKTKINITFDNDIPNISLKIDLQADIISLDKNVDYEVDKVLSKISNAAKEYLTKEFDKYLKKVSTEYESDIDYFSTKASAHFLTISDWDNYNWNEKFKNSKFNIDVNVNVLSSVLVTET